MRDIEISYPKYPVGLLYFGRRSPWKRSEPKTRRVWCCFFFSGLFGVLAQVMKRHEESKIFGPRTGRGSPFESEGNSIGAITGKDVMFHEIQNTPSLHALCNVQILERKRERLITYKWIQTMEKVGWTWASKMHHVPLFVESICWPSAPASCSNAGPHRWGSATRWPLGIVPFCFGVDWTN